MLLLQLLLLLMSMLLFLLMLLLWVGADVVVDGDVKYGTSNQ